MTLQERTPVLSHDEVPSKMEATRIGDNSGGGACDRSFPDGQIDLVKYRKTDKEYMHGINRIKRYNERRNN